MVEMSDKAKPQDDMSIEEILGSIRRIIAEDDVDAPAPETAGANATDADVAMAMAAVMADAGEGPEYEEEEPLELTDRIDEDGTITSTQSDEINLEMNDVNDDVQIDLAEENLDAAPEPQPVEPAPVQQNTAPPQEPKPMSTENIVPDNLLSPSASIATAAVMAKLARQAAINEDGNGSVTLEAMVREMIRPMLKEWLDANLPDLVQKMVERELDRLTKRL